MSGTGQTLYRRARKVIPGGTQLLSKRPEMFLPEQWPTYFKSAKGAEVIDLDGRTYLDMSYCGIGATVLGFADPDVDAAVKRAIDMGSMSTLNCAEDIELAELLVEGHPWADMVRFGRAGGEAMAIAVRIARAATGRDMVAFCGYHGWHDWYLSANLGTTTALDGHLLPGLDTKGVPRGLAGLMHPFHFNKLDEIEAIVAEHGERLAAIVMEPVRSSEPTPEFIGGIRALADRCGAVLIFDEVTSGFRINSGGAHLAYGVDPDIAVFAKAIANGYPMAAIVGRASVMDAAQETFVSSTAWTERVGPVAALATLRKHREQNVPRHLMRIGTRVQKGWTAASQATGLPAACFGHLAARAFRVRPAGGPGGAHAVHADDARPRHLRHRLVLCDVVAHRRPCRPLSGSGERCVPRPAGGGRPEGGQAVAARPGRPFRFQAVDLIEPPILRRRC